MDLASFTFDASFEATSFPLASACLTELDEPFCNIIVHLLKIKSGANRKYFSITQPVPTEEKSIHLTTKNYRTQKFKPL